jgi:nitroreductase
MTTMAQSKLAEIRRRAAARATLAPSVHNTQPWRFVLTPDAMEIWVDRTRQLQQLDPSGRQLMISCGCALFNARVAFAAAGYEATVTRFPDLNQPDLLARITLPERAGDPVPIGALDAVIELRQTNRREFAEDDVPSDVIEDLVAAAAAEDAELFVIKSMDHRSATARLSQQADTIQIADPAYRAELRTWTSADPQQRDGVPSFAVPHVDAGAEDDIPVRDFDTHGMGWLPTRTHSSMQQCLLLLGTKSDTPPAWLRAGEALERLWLEATRHGYVASPLTQVVEVPRTRATLRQELHLQMNPHVLMRVGRAPITAASRRRSLTDVVTESSG